MKLAEKIQLQRKKLGISQEKLGEIVGVSRQAITKWETGNTLPEIDKIIILSDYFRVSTDYLLKDDFIEQEEAQILINPEKKPIASWRMKTGIILLCFSLFAWLALLLISRYFPVSAMTGYGIHLTGFSGFLRYHELQIECYVISAIGFCGLLLIMIEVWFCRFKSSSKK